MSLPTTPLVIFGTGQIAELAQFYFENDSDYRVVAFVVDREYIESDSLHGLPVVAADEVSQRFPATSHAAFVAISYARINALRAEKVKRMQELGYRLASYVSSRVTAFPGLEVGENCFILEDNTIQPFARIGHNVTLWSGNHIGHHSSICDDVFISSHVVISGGVEVGARTFIGVNSTIRDHVTIGPRCVIGAGSLIVTDCEADGVYTTPAAERSRVPSSRLKRI
jgi:sugar O-acyltransferase (sialic acid O-acetyltransferase NeuD family)